VQWFDASNIGEEIIALLPGDVATLDAETLRQVTDAFGNRESEVVRVN
jgi:hypothetical protein